MSKAEEIRRRREALGLSQGELAELVGKPCKQQDIYRIEDPGPKGTRNSKYHPAIFQALERLEAEKSGSGVPVSEPKTAPGIAPEDVQAALEVLFRRMSRTDKAALWAAQTLLQELQSRGPLPYGLDRQGRVRSVAHDIIVGLSEQEQ
jgi:transcriptional regulator with XRE-family HTH domain